MGYAIFLETGEIIGDARQAMRDRGLGYQSYPAYLPEDTLCTDAGREDV